MGDVMFALTASSWVLVVVFVVSGLDAVLPFMPSETTVVAVGVVAAQTGHPRLASLIAVAATGAFVGDEVSFRLGRRSDSALAARLDHGRRGRFVHQNAQRMLHRRGGLLIVFARYLPAGRSATAFTAGVVGYPAARFRLYTAGAVTIWATQGAFLGYFGGVTFADEPLVAFLVAGAVGMITMMSIAACRLFRRLRSTGQGRSHRRQVAPGWLPGDGCRRSRLHPVHAVLTRGLSHRARRSGRVVDRP